MWVFLQIPESKNVHIGVTGEAKLPLGECVSKQCMCVFCNNLMTCPGWSCLSPNDYGIDSLRHPHYLD